MKEYTNKLAFNDQTLQEAVKHRAAVEQVHGVRAGCELFQGWALTTGG